MKTLAVIGCILVVTSVVHGLGGLNKYIDNNSKVVEECSTELGLSEDQKGRLLDFASWSEEDKKKMMCMTTCTFKKMGAMKDGKLVADGLHKIVENVHKGNDKLITDLKKAADTCREEAQTEANECDVGYAFATCYTLAYSAM